MISYNCKHIRNIVNEDCNSTINWRKTLSSVERHYRLWLCIMTCNNCKHIICIINRDSNGIINWGRNIILCRETLSIMIIHYDLPQLEISIINRDSNGIINWRRSNIISRETLSIVIIHNDLQHLQTYYQHYQQR